MSRPASTGPNQQQPPLQLSPLERPAFAHLFSLADSSKSGLITGDQAVSFFSNAQPSLPPSTLGLIWSLADVNNNGFLTAQSFSIALRLIGHAQRGEQINQSWINKPGNPPGFKGVTFPAQSGSLSNSNNVPDPNAASTSSSNNPNYIPISPSDRTRYTRIFANSNPQNGLIDGDKAKEIFVKSKLPFDKLGAIWNLADTHARGSLDVTDFIIGMHFIQHTMSGRLNSIPAALPSGLYEMASNGVPVSNAMPNSPMVAQSTGGSQGAASGFGGAVPRQMTGSNVPIARQLTGQQQGGVQRQLTGQQQSGYMSPSQSNSTFAQAQSQNQARGNWLVTPTDQLKSDRFFDGLDVEKAGALEGQTVVPFFMQSGLGESVLAHIWDLSDITQSGSLSREEFAVAMYLINGKLAGQEPPQELPENLVPPSLRGKNLPEAVNPQESDTQRDLFSLMDDDPAPLPISTASAFINPAAQVSSPQPAASTLRKPPATASSPFDDDFFVSPAPAAVTARSAIASPAAVNPNVTGTRSPPPPTAPKGVTFVDDASAEMGNKQLQLDNTNNSVSSLQSQRQDLSSAVSSGAADLAEIESRLAQARATHDSESKLVSDLQERQKVQNDSLKTAREELIRAESDLSALKAEKDEVEQAVMRDREDVRDLQRKMTAVQNETNKLKEELEKLKKEARQKKGMVAIGKKQLASADTEKEKVEEELENVKAGDAEVQDAGPTPSSASNHAAASATTSPRSPAGALSPSSVRSLNPFDRVGSGENKSHSPTTSLAAIGTGAGAGAALGLTGASVAHEYSSSAHEERQTAESSEFDDAFGVPATSAEKEASGISTSQPAFDDDFGSSGFDSGVGAGAGAGAGSGQNVATGQDVGDSNTAFDDAFADFGDDHTQPATNASNVDQQQSQPAISDGFEETFAPAQIQPDELSIPVTTAATIDQAEVQTDPPASTSDAAPSSEPFGAHSHAPAEEHLAIPSEPAPVPASDQEIEDSEDDVPLSETVAAKRKSRVLEVGDLSQSSAVDQRSISNGAEDTLTATLAASNDEDSSDDETDEGPEDLDSQPHRNRGASTATATPANVQVPEGLEPPTAVTGKEGPLASAESTNQASDRFPELSAVEDEPSASMPGSIGVGVAPPFGAPETLSAPSQTHAPISTRTSDAGDDFHDAFDEAPTSSNADTFAEPIATSAIVGGAESTFSNISQQGSEIGHERFSTALGGDDLGSSAANATTSSLSPEYSSATLPAAAGTTPASSLAAKTRRAPPPAPVRTPNSLTPTGGAGSGSQQLPNNDSFAPTISSSYSGPAKEVGSDQQQQQSTSSLDDFDSAFEDLGATTNSSGNQSASASNANIGFDDAFGAGDSDFDFVPSFETSNANNQAQSFGTSAGEIGKSSSNAFDGFGSAAQSSNTNGADSFAGFDDFDSAFNPDGAMSNNNSSSNTQNNPSNSNSGSGFSFEDAFDPSAASAPSLPARSSTQQTSAASVASTPAPPSSSRQPDNALSDDAGQVKQLCGMGFSRSNVIKALEKSNYRTEKALEKLLAEA